MMRTQRVSSRVWLVAEGKKTKRGNRFRWRKTMMTATRMVTSVLDIKDHLEATQRKTVSQMPKDNASDLHKFVGSNSKE